MMLYESKLQRSFQPDSAVPGLRRTYIGRYYRHSGVCDYWIVGDNHKTE